jgi:phosphopantetheine adenylyltransferase
LLRGLWRGQHRLELTLLAAVLVSTTVLTAALEIPLYRYRMGLEPLMVLIVALGVTANGRSIGQQPLV